MQVLGKTMLTRSFGRFSLLARQHSTFREGGSRWSKYGSAVGAVISTGAAVVSIYSGQVQKRKEFGRAFAELQNDFYTTEMDRVQRKLYKLKIRADNEGRSWDDMCGEWAADDLTLTLTPPEKLSKDQKIRLKEVEDMEEARRKWSGFFIKFRSLYNRGVISEEDVKQHHFPSETQMKGYIAVTEPMLHACTVIFVGDVTVPRYRAAKVAGFLDTTFLGGRNIPTDDKFRERHEKYILLRKQVLDKMKPESQTGGGGVIPMP
ncbi:uncharacterized protein [Branchiostoma lanceolatum]|uniref:uncharacterized protein n=1 Tax=Branchiostoma lanceolatum TaxID=7740 RepID=UPI0034518CFE